MRVQNYLEIFLVRTRQTTSTNHLPNFSIKVTKTKLNTTILLFSRKRTSHTPILLRMWANSCIVKTKQKLLFLCHCKYDKSEVHLVTAWFVYRVLLHMVSFTLFTSCYIYIMRFIISFLLAVNLSVTKLWMTCSNLIDVK